MERIEFLLNASHLLVGNPISAHLNSQFSLVANEDDLAVSASVVRRFCQTCGTLFLPLGSTSRLLLSPQNNESHMHIKCHLCEAELNLAVPVECIPTPSMQSDVIESKVESMPMTASSSIIPSKTTSKVEAKKKKKKTDLKSLLAQSNASPSSSGFQLSDFLKDL